MAKICVINLFFQQFDRARIILEISSFKRPVSWNTIFNCENLL